MTPPRVTTQQLVDLVLDPRDPGYESAAQRRGGTPARHWYDAPIVTIACLVLGFLLAIAWVHTHRGAPAAAKVHDRLVGQVRAAERTGNDLTHTEVALSGELDRLRASALSGSSGLVRTIDRDQLLAGVTPATGQGVEVRLSEPALPSPSSVPGRGGRAPTTTGHILMDRDVRSVVNQLWSDGAEAIAVNGLRLTPTSAIRFAGDAVLVDFQPISSPYVMQAIGNSGNLITGFAASDIASRYQTLASARGIGFSFSEKSNLTLPGSPSVSLRYARPRTAR
ncbi:MAG: DUF881 domain-containing protein [Jatrophihabitantaceae bacterium]